MDNTFEPVSKPLGSIFEDKEIKSSSVSNVFELTSSPKGHVFEPGGTISASSCSYQQQASTQEHERIRCSICGNLVDALVLEKTAMCNKYRCTFPGCGALFSTPGPAAKGAKILGTTVGVINAGIGLIKIFGGDLSGIGDMFHGNSTEV